MDTATLLWGVIFGAIGAGYWMYGKRQSAIMPMLCGAGLVVFPYFVGNAWLMVLVGAVLMAIPWFVRV